MQMMENLSCSLVSSKLYSDALYILQMKIVVFVVFTDNIVKLITTQRSLTEIAIGSGLKVLCGEYISRSAVESELR